MGMLNWIKEAIKNPRELSTIFPSSPFLAREIAGKMDFSKPRVIAELGPGDGALTKPIVRQMHPDSTLLLVEVNDAFCEELKQKYAEHEKSGAITVLNRSADELEDICEEMNLDGLDYVVSGLPLTTLPDDLSERILRTVHGALKPDGRYVQFQYSLDYKDNIEAVFGPVEISKVWLNIFPANVYVADMDKAPPAEEIRADETGRETPAEHTSDVERVD